MNLSDLFNLTWSKNQNGRKSCRIEIANNIEEGEHFETFVAGNLCFTGDLLGKIKNKLIRKPRRGDYLLFYDTGAYSDFFASNANSFPRPSKVMVAKDGTHKLLVRREDFSEVFQREEGWVIPRT